MQHRRDVITLVLYFALALTLTYPLALNFYTHVAGTETDAPTLAWNLWWVKYSLFNLRTHPLSTDYLFYPLGVNLVAYTLTLFNALLALPIQFSANIPAANNALVLFSLTISAFGMYLLAQERLRRAGLDPRAAFFAGALYGFGSYHLSYVAQGRLDLVGSQWLPFFFFYLLRTLESPRRAWKSGAWMGLFFALTAWTELTYAAFLLVLSAFGLVLSLQAPFGAAQGLGVGSEARSGIRGVGSSRTDRKIRARLRPMLNGFLAFTFTAALGTFPLWYTFIAEVQRYGDYWTIVVPRAQILSADLLGFLLPPSAHPFVGKLTQGIAFQSLTSAFIGFAPLALFVWGIARWRAARVWAWLALAFALLMLGPSLSVAGNITSIPMPFALLQQIPFLKATRFPVRLNAFFMLAFALTASYAVARLLEIARDNPRARAGALLFMLFAFAEQLAFPIPLTDLRAPAVYQQFTRDPGDFTILELPLGWRNNVGIQGKLDFRAQFFQSVHQKRLLGGTTARNPIFKFQYYNELPMLNSLIALETGQEIDPVRHELDREAALEVLRFFNIHHVVVNRTLTDPAVEAYVKDILPLREVYRDDTSTLYRVITALPLHGTVESHHETARLNFDDTWGRAQTTPDQLSYRWSTAADARVWLPLTRRDYRIAFLAQTPRYEQKVSVRINGFALDPIIGTDTWDPFSLHVPSVFLRNGLNELVFSTDLTPLDAARLDDYRIGATGIVAPVDIAATGAGFNAGRFGEIFVAGQNVVENRRGYHLVTLDAQTGRVNRVGAFDTFASADESRRMAAFIEDIPRGEIVAGVAVDEVSKNLQEDAANALRQVGVETDLRFAFRTAHAFIGVKGASAGTAIEVADGRFPANVYVGKNVRAQSVSLALGPLFFEELR